MGRAAGRHGKRVAGSTADQVASDLAVQERGAQGAAEQLYDAEARTCD